MFERHASRRTASPVGPIPRRTVVAALVAALVAVAGEVVMRALEVPADAKHTVLSALLALGITGTAYVTVEHRPVVAHPEPASDRPGATQPATLTTAGRG